MPAWVYPPGMRVELAIFQSLNWHAQVVVKPACGFPNDRVEAAMPQHRAVESLPWAGPAEVGTQMVVGDLELPAFVPKKKKSGCPPEATFSG